MSQRDYRDLDPVLVEIVLKELEAGDAGNDQVPQSGAVARSSAAEHFVARCSRRAQTKGVLNDPRQRAQGRDVGDGEIAAVGGAILSMR